MFNLSQHAPSLVYKQVAYISEGTLVIGANMLVLLAIGTNRALRQRQEMILLFSLAIADGLAGVALFSGGWRRMSVLWTYPGPNLPNVTSWYCMTTVTTPLFTSSDIAPPVMLLLIAGDRLKAVMRPAAYRASKQPPWLLSSCGFLLVAGFLAIGAGSSFALSPKKQHSILCFSESSYAEWYPKLLHGSAMVISWAGILIYLAIAISVQKMAKTMNKGVGKAAAVRSEREKAVTQTVLLVAACTAVFHTIPVTTYWLMFIAAGEHVADRLGQTVSILAAVNSTNNIFIYVWRHKELRNNIFRVLGLKRFSTVVPVTIA